MDEITVAGLVSDEGGEVVDVGVKDDDGNKVEVEDGKGVVDENVVGNDEVVAGVVDTDDDVGGGVGDVDGEVGKDNGVEGEG